MQRVPDPPNTPKGFGEGKVIERFGLALNGGAIMKRDRFLFTQ